jgi:hypothetical protein
VTDEEGKFRLRGLLVRLWMCLAGSGFPLWSEVLWWPQDHLEWGGPQGWEWGSGISSPYFSWHGCLLSSQLNELGFEIHGIGCLWLMPGLWKQMLTGPEEHCNITH